LATRALNKDGSKKPCIAYGLLTDREGSPHRRERLSGPHLGYGHDRRPGRQTAHAFSLQRVVLVGDRGMITDTRIEEFRAHEAIGWISALRSEAITEIGR
jgi:hypothetical protein